MLSGVFHLHEQQARQVMTPIPAVVTVDASETRRGGAAARGRLRPHAARRDRGRQHRPHQGHRARELARAEGDDRGPGRVDREQREGRADRARDEAARRPARRPSARARVDGRGRGRVRPHRRHRHRSRTSSRRSWARSPTRPTPRWPACGGSRTATGGCAATCRSRTWPTTASTCRWTRRPTTRSAASCSASSAGCRSAATWCSVNGYSLRVEAVRENRVEAVRIRDHEARGEDRGHAGHRRVRPVEQAASTPREVERRASEAQ